VRPGCRRPSRRSRQDEQQMGPQLAAHPADHLLETFVLGVEAAGSRRRQVALRELIDRPQHHVQHVCVETGHGSSSRIAAGMLHLSAVASSALLDSALQGSSARPVGGRLRRPSSAGASSGRTCSGLRGEPSRRLLSKASCSSGA
jgi:hypothetical protein